MEEPDYCTICYYNELIKMSQPVPEGDTGTIELDCKHRFCGECTLASLE